MVETDRPLDRHLVGMPGLQVLEITEGGLDWGALGLSLRGRLEADRQGRAEGRIELRATDLDALLDLAEPLLPDGQMRLGRLILTGIASQSDGWIPLPVTGGIVSFGPLPIAALPLMREPAP